MASIARIQAVWSGFQGAPGASTWYTLPAGQSPVLDAVATFFGAIQGLLPDDVTISFPGSGDIIEDTTGAVVDEWSDATPPAAVIGDDVDQYAGPVGGVVNWRTSTFIAGRRLAGKTFLVPLGRSAYAGDGTLASTAVSTLQTAATALVGVAEGIRVWHRPTGDPPSGGSSAVVTSATVPDLAAVLRSRRD